MVDKAKKSPLPERTSQIGDREAYMKQRQKEVPTEQPTSDPAFIRGTIDPPTKKER